MFNECRTAVEPLLPPEQTQGLSGVLPPEFCRRAVEHYCGKEWAIHLDDVMVRRTSWHYYYSDAEQKAERVADWMAELLAWSDAQRTAELERYRAELNAGRGTGHADPVPAKPSAQGKPDSLHAFR